MEPGKNRTKIQTKMKGRSVDTTAHTSRTLVHCTSEHQVIENDTFLIGLVYFKVIGEEDLGNILPVSGPFTVATWLERCKKEGEKLDEDEGLGDWDYLELGTFLDNLTELAHHFTLLLTSIFSSSSSITVDRGRLPTRTTSLLQQRTNAIEAARMIDVPGKKEGESVMQYPNLNNPTKKSQRAKKRVDIQNSTSHKDDDRENETKIGRKDTALITDPRVKSQRYTSKTQYA
ncbi:hypothetical protein DFP72DRAFT_846399 [Ephemerocybe angulata]|uniref:Uncharacterized protein n=1 Tax=Ephemerocybe angulata TaxID=980116 RepID=A0A8H6M6V7_9AGAR|nr:hypothetical protein DFP72DRAFT_846399 [Tulosesus angulatus]